MSLFVFFISLLKVAQHVSLSPEKYWVWNADQKGPHNVVKANQYRRYNAVEHSSVETE